jgi:hypothetical protein
MTYVLRGDPLPYREFKTVKNIWNEYKQEQLRRSIELERQMTTKSMITGPVHIDYVFSFDVKKGQTRSLDVQHQSRPCVDDLIRYIHMLARERIYIPESVVSFSARKEYALEPGTQFIIRRFNEN